MKTILISTALLLFSTVNGVASSINPSNDTMAAANHGLSETGTTAKKISLKLLDAEEASQMLYPASRWMEVKASDNQNIQTFRILDKEGKTITKGTFKNGKALINITEMASGKYLVVVGESLNRTIQPLELLN